MPHEKVNFAPYEQRIVDKGFTDLQFTHQAGISVRTLHRWRLAGEMPQKWVQVVEIVLNEGVPITSCTTWLVQLLHAIGKSGFDLNKITTDGMTSLLLLREAVPKAPSPELVLELLKNRHDEG